MDQKYDIRGSFWSELKRRRVIHMITVYGAVAFVILQVADIVAQPLQLPDWTEAFVIVLLSIGFVIAVFLSWVYDVTPTGVKKTKPENSLRHANQTNQVTPGGWKIATIISAIVIIALMAFNFINKGKFEDLSKLEKSIAVLPFRNDSPNDTNAYFINGIMEEVLNHLQLVKDLRVISRTSVEQYRNTTKSIPEIAKEQGVNYIVEGSGQKYGNSFRISVQLIRAAKENHLWGKSFDQKIRGPGDIIIVQSKIAESIASELEGTITPEEKQQIEKVHTSNLTAYDYYQKGREEFMKYWIDEDNKIPLERAGKLYSKALEADPEFSDAYVGLAEIYWSKHYYADFLTENALDSVLILANIALSFDDQIADAYVVKGWYYGDMGKTDKAFEEYDEAIKLKPSDWKAYFGKACLYDFIDPLKRLENLQKAASLTHGAEELPTIIRNIGGQLLITGFIEKSKDYFSRAFELDGDSAFFWSCLGGIEDNQGNYEKALECYKNAYHIRNKFTSLLFNLGQFSQFKGQYKESMKYYNEIISMHKVLPYDKFRLGYDCWQTGLREEANNYFNEQLKFCNDVLKSNRPFEQVFMRYYELACISAFRGDKDKAYQYLRLFSQDRNCYLWMVTLIKNDPFFNNLRNEPEYQQIVKDMERKYQTEHELVGRWLQDNEMA